MDSEQIFIIALSGISAIALVVIVPVVGYWWHRGRSLALRQAMLDKGYTADDICRVIEAGETSEEKAKWKAGRS